MQNRSNHAFIQHLAERKSSTLQQTSAAAQQQNEYPTEEIGSGQQILAFRSG
jgi:hypothetical protein